MCKIQIVFTMFLIKFNSLKPHNALLTGISKSSVKLELLKYCLVQYKLTYTKIHAAEAYLYGQND